MNSIIMSDSLRPDHLAGYGHAWCHTPTSAAFAKMAAIFDNSYAGSFPTIPNRTDLLTGRYGEPFHPWLPLAYGETTLPQILRDHGYVTQLICDTPHLINGGHNFDYPYHAWRFIRGHECDAFGMDSDPIEFTFKDASKVKAELTNRAVAQYHRNMRGRRRQVEEDWPTYRTYQTAVNWLERNRKHKKFFLWIDGFEPHEPNIPPQHYIDLYDPGYTGDVFLAHVKDVNLLSEAEVRHIKARYAASVTFVDAQAGRLLDTLERLQLADNTCVVWMSDHGTHLKEHGQILSKSCEWNEVARTVLMVRVPGMKTAGRRFGDLVQPADLAPTLLEMAGVEVPGAMQGRSYLPLLEGKPFQTRAVALTAGRQLVHELPSKNYSPIHARDQRWALCYHPNPSRRRLYDIQSDPGQTANVIADHPRVVQRLHEAILEFLRTHDAPPQVVRLYETGDPGDMTGFVPIRPGCEQFEIYLRHLLSCGVLRESGAPGARRKGT